MKGYTIGFAHWYLAGFTVVQEMSSKVNGPVNVVNIIKGSSVMLRTV